MLPDENTPTVEQTMANEASREKTLVVTNLIDIEQCRTPDCRWFDKTRKVGMLYLGQGVYQKPKVVCECGEELKVFKP